MASPERPTNLPVSRRGLFAGIASLYRNDEYTDLTIKTECQNFRVHKAVVCPQSSFFAKACKAEWQQNSSNPVVELYTEDVRVVRMMVQYFYLSDFSDEVWTDAGCPLGPIEFNVDMFIAADKYDIPDLAELAINNFYRHVKQFANRGDFIRAVRTLLARAPNVAGTAQLRDKAIQAATLHAKTLLASSNDDAADNAADNANAATFKSLIADFPDFVEAVMKKLADHGDEKLKRQALEQSTTMMECNACGRIFPCSEDEDASTVLCPNCGSFWTMPQ